VAEIGVAFSPPDRGPASAYSDHSPMIAHLGFSQFLEQNSRKESRAAECGVSRQMVAISASDPDS
jgi:hypothetical protein